MAERREAGTATAELAVAMPAVAVVLGVVLALGQATLAQLQCVDAARAGARAAARGDDPGAVREVAARAAPGAVVRVGRAGDQVTVAVARRVRLVLARGPSVTVRASATAASERGSATVLVAAACLVALVLAAGLGTVGSAVVARHRAQAAADLAALAGADVLLGRRTGDPCPVAVRVAQANGARLAACAVRGSDVEVTATVRPSGRARYAGTAVARSRAGPG